MRRSVAAVAVVCLLAACDGNPLLVEEAAEEEPIDDGVVDGEEVEVTEAGIPVVVARNLEEIRYDPVAKTLEVTISGLDGTPERVTYARNAAAEAGLPAGYEAYSLQEDPLDRYFTAVVRQSFDGKVRAGAVSDGGQFNRFFSGGYYERDGGFDKPPIGTGPGAGQVTYAGGYAGLDNFTGPFPPMPPGTDGSIQPQAPGRVIGSVVINANFSDMLLNGAIFDRQLLDNPGLFDPANLALIVTDINEDGTFLGQVEAEIVTDTRVEERIVGDYAGIFGGDDASSLGGVLYITNYVDLDSMDNPIQEEAETGVFVLTQCGKPGADPTLCTGAAP